MMANERTMVPPLAVMVSFIAWAIACTNGLASVMSAYQTVFPFSRVGSAAPVDAEDPGSDEAPAELATAGEDAIDDPADDGETGGALDAAGDDVDEDDEGGAEVDEHPACTSRARAPIVARPTWRLIMRCPIRRRAVR